MSQVESEQVTKFIDFVSKKFGLSVVELQKLWVECTEEQSAAEKKFKGMKKVELVELCKTQSVRHSGTIPELIRRLTAASGAPPPPPSLAGKAKAKAAPKAPPAKSGKAKAAPKTARSKTTEIKGKMPAPTVEPPKTIIKKNAFGNYFHPESSVVFRPDSKEAYGIQQDDGTILPLTPKDIETCKCFNFKVEIPENLETDVVIDNESEDIDDVIAELEKASEESDDDLEEEVESD
jgi:hypothetical protein